MFLKNKILIVEDNVLNQKILSFWLSKRDYYFIFALTGEEAVEIFKREWYDIVIMDIMLPGINGIITAKLLRDVAGAVYGKQPFIIALTANVLDNDRKKCIQAGMDDYLAKPFDFDKLVNILESIN